jgi:hypothetical protein
VAPAHPPAPRSLLRSVALPDEHGGWGLTLEPVLLGLLVAPSGAGAALGATAFLAFLVRTPLRVVLVDHFRRRWLLRTRVAAVVAAVELVAIAALVHQAWRWAGAAWLPPVLVAGPLVFVELWYDRRSRSRRLVPELAGSVGIASVAATIALAGGEGGALAAALWLVLAGRSLASIPHARTQVDRLHGRPTNQLASDLAQLAGIVVAGTATVLAPHVVGGLVAVFALAAVHTASARRPPRRAVVVGLVELVLGLVVVGATAASALVAA